MNILLGLYLFQSSFGVDCWVPGTDTIIFEIISDTNTDVVDSNSNYLKKAVPCTIISTAWGIIEGAIRIWDDTNNYSKGKKYFRINFEIIGLPIAGIIIAGCDDTVNIFVNGIDANCKSTHAHYLFNCDLLSYLKSGYNYVLFASENIWGEGGLVYKLTVESQF